MFKNVESYMHCFQTKSKQQKIEMILTSKKIEFEKIDISSEAGAKDEMRAIIGDPKALAPQLINDDKYCGVGSTGFYTQYENLPMQYTDIFLTLKNENFSAEKKKKKR